MMWISMLAVTAGLAASPPLEAAREAASLRFISDAEGGNRFVARGPHYAVRLRGDGAEIAAGAESLYLSLVGADGSAEGRG